MTTSHPSGFSATSAIGANPPLAANRSGHVSTKAWGGVGSQWGAIAAGAFTGLAVGVVMATFGAALGLSASAAAADHASKNLVTADAAGTAAVGFGVGTGVWLLISAVVVGIAGGLVLARTSHPDRPYAPGVLGVATWAFGLCIAVFLAASGASGLATGVGVGAAGAASAAPVAMRALDVGSTTPPDARGNVAPDVATVGNGARAADASSGRNVPALTAEERQAAIAAAEIAATAAATAAWFALVAQLLGLGATLWGAGSRKFQASTAIAVQHA